MLNGVHLVDFGNHRNTRVTFGRMTALVGQNGSGKTTVMRAIQQLALAVDAVPRTPGSTSAFKRRGGEKVRLSVSWSNPGEEIDYGAAVASGCAFFERRRHRKETAAWIPEAGREPTDGEIEELERKRRHALFENDDPSEMPAGKTFYRENRWIGWRSRYFKTSASMLNRPAFVDPETVGLDESGSNLAWALASLMTEYPERFARIVEALREVVPVVKRIRSRPIAMTRTEKQTVTINDHERTFEEERTVPGQELLFDMRSGDNLPASMVSEGTLVVLAVLTLVHGAEADLIMLDDVELGLHPKAQRDLIRQLRRIQETHPKLQIILSTHSPYVVDEMQPEEVWVFAPDAEGCAVVHRLDEHPNAKRAMEVLTTGEFWSAEGESWVVDASRAQGEDTRTARVAEEPPAA
ncbi:MAG TPA: AAA family ATPase [Chthoniobacteraceae bacterium]|jgi:predicted ATPase|nr:AAA family ATPase [Chthoniobacteraceae bacterium]